MMLLLTPQERYRFAVWLEQEAASEEGLLEQMEKLAMAGSDVIVKRMKLRRAAYLIVAMDLRRTEDMTLEG